MSKNFQPLTIKDIRKETDDCVSIAFDIPVELSNQFVFKQGQYITLKTTIQNEEVRLNNTIGDNNKLKVEIDIMRKEILFAKDGIRVM